MDHHNGPFDVDEGPEAAVGLDAVEAREEAYFAVERR